jgi:hypothetical protein
MSDKLSRLLTTALALSEQFQAALISAAPAQADDSANQPQPLKLLSDSSKTLKAQVTKLSLLAISTPFTHSALSTVLTAVNDSVMPALVTAALLVTPVACTKTFADETKLLARTALKELSFLLKEVEKIAKNKNSANEARRNEEISKAEKDAVTSQTGRVWDACDSVLDLATKGVVGHVVRRVEEWRDLVKDAISELEEWDPEDDDDDLDDALFGHDDNGEEEEEEEEEEKAGEGDTKQRDEETMVALRRQKKETLRLFKPIAQIYPAIISNRLRKGGLTVSIGIRTHVPKLESLISDLQTIPSHVDEAAGSLYEENVVNSILHLKKAKTSAERAMKLVALPWEVTTNAPGQQAQAQEDKFTTWSRTWLKVMDSMMSNNDS